MEVKLEKLVHFKSELLGRGNILRVNGIYPHESVVDLMVFDTQKSECPLGLIVTTGYKAGLVLQTYPQEAYSPNEWGIYRDWLISNWQHWGYPECDINDVYIIDRYLLSPQQH